MLAAVRVRGQPDLNKRQEETLENLGLTQKNHGILLPDTEAMRGMLRTVKDAVTYGQIDAETAASVLNARGTVPDDEDVQDIADALDDGSLTKSEAQDRGVDLVLRLRPPSGGYADTRHHVGQGGSLGERETMDDLLERMA
ncbi:MAG: uL30 family ribosomal protein [Candidatus Nanohaloarchaeota archaeon QJJ-5]|nr:uL30 family ribosomal protein [Candidatus Nanohaloarchaeota archaeon QJJ-5]